MCDKWSNRKIKSSSRARRAELGVGPNKTVRQIERRLDEYHTSKIVLGMEHWIMPGGKIYAGYDQELSFTAFPGKNLQDCHLGRDFEGIVTLWMPKGGSPIVNVPLEPTSAQLNLIRDTMTKYPDDYIFHYPGEPKYAWTHDYNDMVSSFADSSND